MDQSSHLPFLIWFGGFLLLSIWGSGLNLFGRPYWVPPRLMFFTGIMGFLSSIMELVPNSRKMLKGKKFYVYVFEDHMQRNSFIHRINGWLLRLSDHESLSLEQRIERMSWTGIMIVNSVMLLFVLISFFVRAVS